MSARVVTIGALAWAGWSLAAWAQDGASIATQGAGANAPACATCHGARGEGNAASSFPRLAGQSAAYLDRQLDAYADGHRQNPIMTPIAKALTNAQREAVATYYAQLPVAAATAAGQGEAGSAAGNATGNPGGARGGNAKGAGGSRAERLATVGDERLQVQGCVNCHGAGGRGEPPAYPYLATQHAGYLRATLGEWKAGTRDTDPTGSMNRIAKQLSDADVAALAQYFASQPTPDTLTLQMRQDAMPGVGAATSTPASGTTSAQPTRPAGTEQGSPTTGGTQGQGGNATQGQTAPGGSSNPK
jgi:cytochrome c553